MLTSNKKADYFTSKWVEWMLFKKNAGKNGNNRYLKILGLGVLIIKKMLYSETSS